MFINKKILILLSLSLSCIGYTEEAKYSNNSTTPVVNVADYYGTIASINDLEANENISAAFNETVGLVFQLHKDLKVGEVAVKEAARITEVLNEQITETHWESSYSSSSASAGALIAGGSYSAESSSSKSWDVTKFLKQNAAAVAEFDAKAINTEGFLDEHLRNYVQTNLGALILMKVAAQKAFSFAFQLGEKEVPTATMTKLYNVVSNITFIGQYQVTRCVETHFADRASASEKKHESQASAFFLFISASGSQESHEQQRWKQKAHTETHCQSEITSGHIAADTVFAFQLGQVDVTTQAIMTAFYQKRNFDLKPDGPILRHSILPAFRPKK